MLIKVIKNLENLNFRLVEIPKWEKNWVWNSQISDNVGELYPANPVIPVLYHLLADIILCFNT